MLRQAVDKIKDTMSRKRKVKKSRFIDQPKQDPSTRSEHIVTREPCNSEEMILAVLRIQAELCPMPTRRPIGYGHPSVNLFAINEKKSNQTKREGVMRVSYVIEESTLSDTRSKSPAKLDDGTDSSDDERSESDLDLHLQLDKDLKDEYRTPVYRRLLMSN